MSKQTEGFDETARAFRNLGNPKGKVRNIRSAERKAAKIYINALKGKAAEAVSQDLSASVGFTHKRAGDEWIDVKIGFKKVVDYGSRKQSYAGQAATFNRGTIGRVRKSGGKTGVIKKTDFIDKAFKQSGKAVLTLLVTNLKKMLQRAVKKSGFVIPLR